MLDRTQPPVQTPLITPLLPMPAIYPLTPNVEMEVLYSGRQPIVRLMLVFFSGEAHALKPCTAGFTAKLLLKGTRYKSAAEVAQYIAQYGAELDIYASADFFTFQLTVIKDHLVPLLDLLMEIIHAASFPVEALELVRKLELQHLKILEKKNMYLAQREFREQLFGEHHPHISLQDLPDQVLWSYTP